MGLFARLFGSGYRNVPPVEAKKLVEAGAQFIDVRNRGEYKEGHAQGARNLALNVLPQQVHALDAAKPIVVICRSGRRSAGAAKFLAKNGFTDVHNVSGGSLAWKSYGLPWND
ncbi:MAG: rhodanese-like domain-containing protein [Candidatus Thermoplasmatota archaeon]|jgi:rhodanese-related sulfurtransferase